MRPVGFSDSFDRAADTPPILGPRGPPVNFNPCPSPVRRLLDDRARSRHVTCMNRALDGSGTPGAPAASIATSRQTTHAVSQSRPTACGWMGHYDGMTAEQRDALGKANKLGLKEDFFLDWLELFRRLGPAMAPQTE
jgi:hypothetical protein